MKIGKFFANLVLLLLALITAGTTALADEITVAKGDTLWGIAEKISLNPLTHKEFTVRSPKGKIRRNPDLIFPGDIVTIPEHLVLAAKKATEPKREKISDYDEKKQTQSAQTMFAPGTAQKKTEVAKNNGAQTTLGTRTTSLQELYVRDNEYPVIEILFAGIMITCLIFASREEPRPPGHTQPQRESENNIFFVGWSYWIERYNTTRFRLGRIRKKLTEEIKHEQINAPSGCPLRQRIDNFRAHHISSFESMEKPLPNEGKIMISRYRPWVIQKGIDIWIAPTKAGRLPSLARYKHNVLQRENRILQDNVAAGFIRYSYPHEQWRLINFQLKKGVLFSYKFTEQKGTEK